MVRFIVVLAAAAAFAMPAQADNFSKYLHRKNAPTLPLTDQCVPVVNAGGTAAYALCGADLLGAFGSSSVPTMASTGFSAFTDSQGTATLADTSAGVTLNDTFQGANVMRTVCKAAPATPYTVTGKLAIGTNLVGLAADVWAGLTWRNTGAADTTKALLSGLFIEGGPQIGMAVNDMTNATTYAGTSEAAVTPSPGVPEIWFALRDDGTAITYSWSADGVRLHPLLTENKSGSFLGASGYNKICLYVNAKAAETSITLERYSESSP